MPVVALEILVILGLILANALFALSEIAVLSSRKTRLQQLAEEGSASAAAALDLAKNPSAFLSTIQTGMTLIGVLTGAFGGATVTEQLAARFERIPALSEYAEALALSIVVVSVTYVSLVLGELVPKRLALSNPERIASMVAAPMQMLSRLAAPMVRILSFSTDTALWILRARPAIEPQVSEEEIKMLIRHATRAGTFEEVEREMIERIFRLGDRNVGALMTPRPNILWLDAESTIPEIRERVMEGDHSYFPVGEGSIERVCGIVSATDILTQSLGGEPVSLRRILREPVFVPESTSALKVLELFRRAHVPVAMVVDEYGVLQGLVTAMDILEGVTGIAARSEDAQEPDALQRADGSWLMDGGMDIDRFRSTLDIPPLPAEEVRHCQTLGGFAMMQLRRIPQTGDRFEWNHYRFEVVDMDGLRVDKILVARQEGAATGDVAGGADGQEPA